MKTLVRLVIAALVLHATFRAGTVYLRHYQYRDSVEQTALFSQRRSDAEIRDQVVELAKFHRVPVKVEDVQVNRTESHLLVNVSYDERIELLPRYFYPWRFNLNVNSLIINLKEAKP